nr:hypothetical protein [Tanacetum cinerariifolium]
TQASSSTICPLTFPHAFKYADLLKSYQEDILESTINAQVIRSVEVISAFSEEEKFVEQSNKEIDEPSLNALLYKKDLTEVVEREANGEKS